MRRIASAALGIFLVGVSGAPLRGQAPPPTFLFVLENTGSLGKIYGFTVNTSTGALSEVSSLPYDTGSNPKLMTVDPTGRFLYVANDEAAGAPADITGYLIDPSSGALTALPGSPFLIGAGPVAMATDPTGRFLYVFAGTVSGSAVSQQSLFEYVIDGVTGSLTPGSLSPTVWEFGAGDIVSSVVFNQIGNLAYLGQNASGINSGSILTCPVDFATGSLGNPSQCASVLPGSGNSSAVALSPSGNFLYSIAASLTSPEADAFTVGQNGQPSEIAGSPYPIGPFPASIALNPAGSFVYVVNRAAQYQAANPPNSYTGSISAFDADPTSGALTAINGSPFPAAINPLSLGVDPGGKFAYVVSTAYVSGTFIGSAQVQGYSIDPSSGALSATPVVSWTGPSNTPGTGAQLVISSAPTGAPNPAPAISSLSSSSIAAAGPPFTLQIDGTGFVPASRAYFGGQPRVTTFVSATQLTANILASDIINEGQAAVFVFNPLPGGGPSNSFELNVSSPSPVLTTLSPASISAQPGPFSLFITGENFLTSSIVNFNGSSTQLITRFISSTLLRADLASGALVAPGTATVTVINPPNGGAGGGTSNPLPLTITPFALTSLSPLSATAGGPAFTLTLNGAGFISGAQVRFNGTSELTTFVSSTQLTAGIPASAIAAPGNPFVSVMNGDGAPSAPLTFTIAFPGNPEQGSISVSPSALLVGSTGAALQITVTGAGFIATPVVSVNGSPRLTTYQSSSTLLATLSPADVAQVGLLSITVKNPAPPGGTSLPAVLDVVDFSLTPISLKQSVSTGGTAIFEFTLASTDGAFVSPVSLSESSQPALPAGAVSFDPSIAAGASPQTVNLSITPPQVSASRIPFGRQPHLAEQVYLVILLAGLMCIGLSRRGAQASGLAPRFVAAWLLACVLWIGACGGAGAGPASSPQAGGSPSPNPDPSTSQPVIYTITVTAKSGTVSRNAAAVTLTVM